MSNDSISRVYQFLANQGDWVSAADKNGDGAVVKTEFRNFMEENFEWDGETTEAGKNDLINSFWNTIDTDQSGKVSGTNLKDKNALNKDEIAAMQDRIEMYEILNEFTSTISAPYVVQDAAGWKKSVSEGLGALVETFIKQGGKPDELEAYLEEKSASVEQKATADYCANEYMKKSMGDFIKEYGYSYAEDNTLKGIIDNFIKSIPEDYTSEDIYEAVLEIIDAYTATAGLAGAENIELLQEYGYNASADSPLNDLQKNILKKSLETDLAKGELKEDYEAYPELFATAIDNYLSGIKFSDFQGIKSDVISSFKSSDAYKSVEKTVEAQKLFDSSELMSKLTDTIGESLAQTIVENGKYMTVYREIQTDVRNKVLQGEFDNNGTLDKDAVLDYIVEQVQSRLAEFYPNGLGDMSLEELNSMYSQLAKAADNQTDADKGLEDHRNAAIEYCKALAEKSAKFEELVKDVFGDNYVSEINKLYPKGDNGIEGKIQDLMERATELGDASELKLADSTWNNITNGTVTVSPGSSKSFVIMPSFTDNDGNAMAITSDRIKYKSSNTTLLNIDNNGNVTVSGAANGDFTATVTILVDGIEVGEKTINIKVVPSAFDWASMSDTSFNGFISMDGSDTTPNTVKSLKELYEGNGVLNLLAHNDMRRGLDWRGAVNESRTALANFVEVLVSACESSGVQYDKTALEAAKNKVIALYNAAFDHSLNNWAGKKKTRDNTFSYDGQTYGYQVAKYWSNSSTMDTAYAHGCSASNNQLGLRISEQYDDGWFQVTVNTRCVMDLFNRFYQEALGL